MTATNFVYLRADVSDTPITFMVDSGSDISVVKCNKLKLNQQFYPTETCSITGIGSGAVNSIGCIYSNINVNDKNLPQKFHIVNNDFPIPTEGILGRDFLAANKCKIDYDSWLLHVNINNEIINVPITNNINGNMVIPPRCQILKQISYCNLIEDSVTFANEIQPGVMYANSIINKNNPYLKIINTTDENIYIPVDFTPEYVPLSNFNIYHINNNQTTCNMARNRKLFQQLNLNNVLSDHQTKLFQLCSKYNDIFALDGDILSENNFYKQTITLNDRNPVYIRNYRTPHSQKTELNNQVQKMLDENIIKHSHSPYNSPLLLVPKKNTGGEKKWRLVVDFRQLNKKIIPDKFPLPRIDEILDQLGRAKYFTTLDLMSGFHQIPLSEESKKYTAFSTDTGHFEFNRLPFGLNISTNSFQRMMTIALSGLPPECAFLYVDDIIVIGCSVEHHLSNLEKVFERMRKYNLKLNPSKCCFFKHEVLFLGHQISSHGILPDKSKFSVIEKYPVPKNSDEARRFVAFCNYYRRFIPNFAQIASPLNKLQRKNTLFEWNQDCQNAFNELKRQLLSPRILKLPDLQKQFILTTDASQLGCGAVLAQKHGDVELPIAFASRTFTKGESKKSTIEQELTAIHWAVTYFRPYLYGQKFLIRTDHRPLIYLFSMKDPSSKLTRMRADLEDYDFSIEYIKGKSNTVSDALSRINIDTEYLRNMYVLTRSMTKKQTNPPVIDKSVQEPDQLYVVDAINNWEVFELPKLSFNIDNVRNKLNYELIIFNKSYSKKLAQVQNFVLFDENYEKPALEKIFQYIEGALPHERNKIQKIAITKEDVLFKMIDMNSFKKIGNSILRNVQIILYNKPKYVIDQMEINNILNFHHNSSTSGHLGVNRLYKKVKPLYSWPDMKKTITAFVKACSLCKVNKHYPTVKTKCIVTTTPMNPFNVVSIDTVGPFSLTERGNRYAVSMQCDFSKFIIMVPIPDKSSRTIAQAVLENCILNFGPMQFIKTDQGTEYKGVFDELCNLLNINHKCSTAYHPQTIGALERNHRCLNEYLRIFTNEARNNWDDWMPFYSFAYNTTPNLEHNYTPFELVFGKPITRFEIIKSDSKIDPLYNHDSYVKELKYRMQIAHKKVYDIINKNKDKRTTSINEKILPTRIKIGDTVFLKNENRNKLDSTFLGPYTIENFNETNACIINSTNGRLVVHKSRLLKI